MIRLVVLFMQAFPVQHYPALEHPGTAPALRTTIDAACGNPAALDRSALLARENQLARDAQSTASRAAGWIALGCARAALDGDGALSHEGPLMVAGNSWAQGAERVLLKALALDPRNSRAAEILAIIALDDLAPDDVGITTAAIVRATAAGISTPVVLRACDDLALGTGDPASARRCATTGLARGADSTWHLIRLARLDFRNADTVTGSREFLAAAQAAHDTASRGEIDWQLQWFLSPDEQAAASQLTDGARAAWIRDRLAERDVRDGQPRGARLAEHFKRLDYALANFRLDIPVAIRKKGGLLAATPENHLSPDSLRSFCEPGLIPAYPFRDYRRWQSEIDDRGVVWLRFGPPEKRIRSSPQCADTTITDIIGRQTDTTARDVLPANAQSVLATNTREAWYYEIDGQPLLLNFEGEKFDGTVEATRLVSGVLGSYLCGVDPLRCRLTQLSIADWTARQPHFGGKAIAPPSSSMVTPEQIVHVRQADRAFISAATTEDDNSVRGDRNVEMTGLLHRLWDPASGEPIALVTYALPVEDLSIQAAAGRRTTVVDFELRQWDPSVDRWDDTVVSRHFAVPDTSVKHANLTGFLVVPSSAGVVAWSLVATQPDHHRGRAADVSTSGLATGSLALSDLVVGAASQGLVWNLHDVALPLAPVDVIDRRDTVSMYYQIRSDAARDGLRTTVALYRVGGATARDSAALQVTFDQALRAGINEIAPTLDVSHLDRGRYRLEVRIVDPQGAVIVHRNTELDLQ